MLFKKLSLLVFWCFICLQAFICSNFNSVSLKLYPKYCIEAVQLWPNDSDTWWFWGFENSVMWWFTYGCHHSKSMWGALKLLTQAKMILIAKDSSLNHMLLLQHATRREVYVTSKFTSLWHVWICFIPSIAWAHWVCFSNT